MTPSVRPNMPMPGGTFSWKRPARISASPSGMRRAAASSSVSASSGVSLEEPVETVLQTTMPRAVQAATSTAALRGPLKVSSLRAVRPSITSLPSQVRSRMAMTISKSFSAAMEAAGLGQPVRKMVTSLSRRSADQSVAVSAMPCQSSRRAMRMASSGR
jgi:hypothetical protein